ncbi:unnamed protein product [Hyaloperonospora brassicae]|uniref:YTH domain-containing protein n=1 Tax=Hyaloperonospora brassicae TaxID=162125 RepID=A0AAV0UE19_HYABA|nr:unnamed protein product [Hyaloperonospora brassicae]
MPHPKKKRRPHVAPRFAQDRRPSDATAKRVAISEQEQAVRDLFSSSTCRCFVLKSFSEANVHKSLKFGIWSTTALHSALLDQVYRASSLTADRPVLLFFSVCNTRHFHGIARMTSSVQTDTQFQLWEKLKYEGFFRVEWLLVKDVPNYVLTGVKMSNTPTKKSITSCRDCEEVLCSEASEFLTRFTEFDSRSSAWDDFAHYDELQIQLEHKRGLVLSDEVDRTELSSYLVPLQEESLAST